MPRTQAPQALPRALRSQVRRGTAHRLLALVIATLTALAAAFIAAPAAMAAQTLEWTGDNSVTDYRTFPTTAEAGATTIVFENSLATGNTIAMSHTLTFDTSTPGYNHDVTLDILANPFDANGGKHTAEVTLTPGTYRYFCAIPGHGEMWGELTVTGDGGGGDDTTAPTVTAEVTGEQDGDGAYVGSATVTVSAEDEGGVASVEYSLDDGQFQAYEEAVVVDEVGAHTLGYRATDEAGNVSEAGSVDFTVVAEGGEPEDNTAPTVSAEVTGEQDEADAYVGSATVTVTAADEEGGSGVASVEYDAHGGHWMPYTEPVVVSEPGEHTVGFRATDEAGNVSEVGSVTFTVAEGTGGGDDTTAPTVNAEVTGEQDEAGAYVGSATVAVTAADEEGGSGVASVEYSLGEDEWLAYEEPVVVSEPGEHTVGFRATDEAGNVSETGSVAFTVAEATGGEDTTAPTVESEVTGEQDPEGNYLGSATLTLTATDEEGGSGVASVEYALGDEEWQAYGEPVVLDEPGSHTVNYRATDEAGNVSESGSVTVVVVEAPAGDTTAPEVSAKLTGARDGDGAYIGRATITLSASDDDSGVALVEWQLDGGTWMRYATRIGVSAAGEHTVSFRATDAAGNVSAPESVTFTVASNEPADTEAPEVSASVSGTRNGDGDFVGRATISITATDEESGVAKREIRVNDGTWQRYGAPVVVAGDGLHRVAYRATDVAGNVSTTGSVMFTVVSLRFDACPGSDVRPTVVIDGNDSTVDNVDTGDGCTINDLVDEDGDYRTHRAFLRHVRSLTSDLVAEKVISRSEKQRIVAAAEASEVGR